MPNKAPTIPRELYDIIKASSDYETFSEEMATPRARMVAAENWGASEVLAKLTELHPDLVSEFEEADLLRVGGQPMRPDTPLFAAVADLLHFCRDALRRRTAAAAHLEAGGDPQRLPADVGVYTEDTRGMREFKKQVEVAKKRADAARLERGGPTPQG